MNSKHQSVATGLLNSIGGQQTTLWTPDKFGLMPTTLVVGDGIDDIYLVAHYDAPNPEDNRKPKLIGSVDTLSGGALNVVENLVRGFGVGCYSVCPIVDTKYRVVDTFGSLVCRFDAPHSDKSTNSYLDVLQSWLFAEGTFVECLVVADYAKGTITKELLELLSLYDFRLVFVDTKSSPQEFVALSSTFGNSCTFLPNRQEHSRYKQLYDFLPSVVRTESEDGVSYLNYGHEVLHCNSMVKPADILSVCGAGDTVTAAVAASRLSGLDWEQSLEVAMMSAAYVCKQPNTSVMVSGQKLIRQYVVNNQKS